MDGVSHAVSYVIYQWYSSFSRIVYCGTRLLSPVWYWCWYLILVMVLTDSLKKGGIFNAAAVLLAICTINTINTINRAMN